MLALLFDRKSLLATGVALGALGALLFAAGFVTGVTFRQERKVAPPYWLLHGPVLPGESQAAHGGGFDTATPSAPAPRAAPPPDGGGEWVPFAQPGEGEEGSGPGVDGGGPAPEPGPSPDGSDTPEPGAAPSGDGGEGGRGAAAGGDQPRLPRVPAPSRPLWSDEPAVPARAVPANERRAAAGAPAVEAAAGRPAEREGSASPAVAAVPELAPVPTAAPELGESERAALDGAWYVQTGAYSVAANAHDQEAELGARFAGAAYRPYLHPITDRRGRRLLTVRLGPFPSRDEATSVAAAFDDVLVGRE
jgi:hypothetical protein